MNAIFMSDDKKRFEEVYCERITQQLHTLIPTLNGIIYSKEMVLSSPELFKETEYIFATWGFEPFTEEEIALCFPKLKCVFYAAGTVQFFARPFLNRGVRIFSAWAANAVPVAEFTVAEIILSNKGFHPTSRVLGTKKFDDANTLFRKFIGNYDAKIGIIGAGMIGKLVINMLKAYRVETLVFDPFLSEEDANKLDVKKVSLSEIFSECNVISNHLADNEKTKNMLNYELFSKMRPYSTFINTGRGAQVVEDDLVRLLTERPDVTALLDVTCPEPLPDSSKLYDLENCILTPHIAGSSGNEFWRLPEYMVEEFLHFINNEPCKYEVTPAMLETMA